MSSVKINLRPLILICFVSMETLTKANEKWRDTQNMYKRSQASDADEVNQKEAANVCKLSTRTAEIDDARINCH